MRYDSDVPTVTYTRTGVVPEAFLWGNLFAVNFAALTRKLKYFEPTFCDLKACKMPTSKLQVHELVSESEKHALSKGFRGAPECLKSGINLPVAYLLPIFFQFFRLTLKKTIKKVTQKSLRRLT